VGVLATVFCGDQAGACEAQARTKAREEAREEILSEITNRAYWIMVQTWASGSPGDWSIAYEMAIHEKYVQLGLDKPKACDPTKACCASTPLRMTLDPKDLPFNNGQQMYAR
jgi:hypothetical protein